MGAMALEVIEGGVPGEYSAFRRESAAICNDAWRGTRAKLLVIGNELIRAKLRLPHGEFQDYLAKDLDFSADHARRFMRIASDIRLSNPAPVSGLPAGIKALDILHRLDDLEYEAGIARGVIHENTTAREAQQLVRDLRQEKATAYVHRPQSSQMPAPCRPVGAGATTYPEMVFLLAECRKAGGYSQLAFDQRIRRADGLTSKYEIPHMDDGRTMTWEALFEALECLGLGIQFVPLQP